MDHLFVTSTVRQHLLVLYLEAWAVATKVSPAFILLFILITGSLKLSLLILHENSNNKSKSSFIFKIQGIFVAAAE